MAFRIGQKVSCIKRGEWSGMPTAIDPVYGGVYTIRTIEDTADGPFLRFHEIHNPPHWFTGVEPRYNARQFRPVAGQKRETSISIFKEILDRENHGLPSRVDYPCDVEGK
jgi:hypothetical protein